MTTKTFVRRDFCWFRDYIYFPLGGNRCSKSRWALNTLIVFAASGLWHGAAYTFIIWGIFHGACMVVERLIYGEKIKFISDKFSAVNCIRLILTFSIVSFAWIFFRINDLSNVLLVFRKICIEPGIPFIDTDTLFMAFIAMIIVFVYDLIEEKGLRSRLLSSECEGMSYLTIVALIIYILAFGVLNGGSFIYFQF